MFKKRVEIGPEEKREKVLPADERIMDACYLQVRGNLAGLQRA
jgi:hypothetical protein